MRETWLYTVVQKLNVCICEHTLSYRSSKMLGITVKYNYTQGKAGAAYGKRNEPFKS